MLGWVSGESRGIHVSSNPVGESGVGGWVAGVLRCVCVCVCVQGLRVMERKNFLSTHSPDRGPGNRSAP